MTKVTFIRLHDQNILSLSAGKSAFLQVLKQIFKERMVARKKKRSLPELYFFVTGLGDLAKSNLSFPTSV